MHIPPEIWGPIFWGTMHIVSMAYPEKPTYAEKRAAKEFFNSFVFLLPCVVCRSHYHEIIQTMPVETWLDNQASLMEWVWMLHNQVNKRLGKDEISMTDFHERYRELADNGLPIPPSNPHAKNMDYAETNAWIRGVATTLAVFALLGVVGGLLWASYSR